MQVGDKVKFQFGSQEKEGTVEKIFPKKVYLKVDFPGQAGKRVIRSIAVLEGKIAAPAKRKKKVKAEKAKPNRTGEKEEKGKAERE